MVEDTMNNTTVFAVLIAVAAIAVILVLKAVAGSDRIDSEQAHELVKSGATLVDVRSPDEFSSGHIEGAKNIPVGNIAARAGEIPKDKPVVLYCRSGARSSRAASVLAGQGYEVHNLGPISAW
jgi:rhodanese-related sulfurtransferase